MASQFPDTQQPFTPAGIQANLQLLTIALLGYNVFPPPDSEAFSAVRIGWQQEGQPFNRITQDVVYVMATEIDDPYDRLRDQQVMVNDDDTVVDLVSTYVRVWECSWEFYGPNSYDRARRVRSGLFTEQAGFLLGSSQLSMITDPGPPLRAPEVDKAGQWWERVDFSCRFNELVTEQEMVANITASEIRLYDSTCPSIGNPLDIISVVSPVVGYGVGIYSEGTYGR